MVSKIEITRKVKILLNSLLCHKKAFIRQLKVHVLLIIIEANTCYFKRSSTLKALHWDSFEYNVLFIAHSWADLGPMRSIVDGTIGGKSLSSIRTIYFLTIDFNIVRFSMRVKAILLLKIYINLDIRIRYSTNMILDLSFDNKYDFI